jgi:Predicted Na+-dependent transporter
MGIITDIILPLSLAFIMFSLGLSLTVSDFSRILKQPKDFILGSISQIIILPTFALLLILIWPLPPEIAIGVMLIAAAPGGATSNIITSFSKGDVALSVSLTAVISLICVFTIPLIVLISLNIIMKTGLNSSISILDIALKMFFIVTIPVVLGMIFRKFLTNFSISFEPIAKNISTTLFALVIIGAILSERE